MAVSLPSVVMELYQGKDDLVVTDNIATRYIYPNLDVKPLDDVRVRDAINLAINREDLCKMVGEDTEPTVNFVAKRMKNNTTGEYFVEEADPPFEENGGKGKRAALSGGVSGWERISCFDLQISVSGIRCRYGQVIQEQLKQNLNIEIKLEAQELQTNYATRRAGNFDLCRMNWTADFADPYTYLSMLLSNGTYNCSGVRDEKYDRLVEASDVETDPVKRNALLHEAEQWAVGEQFYIIPLFSMKSCNLIRPDITGVSQIPATGALEYRYADVKGD